MQCLEIYFLMIGNCHLTMPSAVDESSVVTTIEMGNQRQSKAQDQGILIGNRERAKACMLTRYWLLDGELSCRVHWETLEAAGGTALAADLVESVAVLGVSTERVFHQRIMSACVRCPGCIVASGVVRGGCTPRRQQTRSFAMTSTSIGKCVFVLCARRPP